MFRKQCRIQPAGRGEQSFDRRARQTARAFEPFGRDDSGATAERYGPAAVMQTIPVEALSQEESCQSGTCDLQADGKDILTARSGKPPRFVVGLPAKSGRPRP